MAETPQVVPDLLERPSAWKTIELNLAELQSINKRSPEDTAKFKEEVGSFLKEYDKITNQDVTFKVDHEWDSIVNDYLTNDSKKIEETMKELYWLAWLEYKEPSFDIVESWKNLFNGVFGPSKEKTKWDLINPHEREGFKKLDWKTNN